MAQQYDGAVRVVTLLDNEGFNKGIERMEKAMQSLSAKMEKLGKTIETSFRAYIRTIQNAGDVTQNLGQNLSGAADQTRELNEAARGTAGAYKEVSKEAEAAKTAVSGFADEAERAGKAGNGSDGVFESIRVQIEELEEAYRDLTISGGSTAQRAEFFTGIDTATTQLYELQSALEKMSDTEEFGRLNTQAQELEGRLYELAKSFDEIRAKPVTAEAEFPILKEIKDAESEFLRYNELYERIIKNEYADADAVKTVADAYQQNATNLQNLQIRLQGMNEAGKLQSGGFNISSEGVERITAKMLELEQKARQAQAELEAMASKMKPAEKDGMSEEAENLAKSIEKAESALDKYQAKTEKMAALGATEKQWDSIKYDIDKAAEKIAEYRAQIESLKDSGVIDSGTYDKFSEALARLQSKASDAQNTVSDALSPAFDETAQSADGAEKSLEGVDKELKQKGPDAEEVGRGVSSLRDAFRGLIQTVLKAGTALLKFAGSAVLSGIRHIGQAAAEAARNLTRMTAWAITTGVKRLGGWLSNAAKSMTLFGRRSKSANSSLKRGFMTVLKYTLGIRSLYILFNRLRAAIKEGFQNLARYSNETNQSLSAVMSSFTRLKNAIAGAFAPIVNVVAPALAQLVNGMSNATSGLGAFIAALSGQKTFIRAKEVQQDYAASLDKTSKAAEETKRQLAGFDELNILSDNKQDETGLNPEDMFETVPIEGAAKDFAEAVRDAWENADFTGIGKTIGKKLKTALDKMPWTNIKKSLQKIAKSLATSLNGFLETPGLFEEAGKRAAESINTAFEFLDTFAWNFRFSSLGSSIMDSVENVCENLEWGTIRSAATGMASGFADLLNSIFTKEDVFSKVGENIGKGVNTFVTAGLAFIDRFNETQAAQSLVTLMNKIVKTVEWDDIGKLLGGFVGGALNFIHDTITNFSWETLGAGLASGVNTLVDKVEAKTKGLDWGETGKALSSGINKFVSDVKWNDLGDLLSKGINSALDFIHSAITTFEWQKNVSAMMTGLNSFLDKIKWNKIGLIISESFSGALGGLAEAIKDFDWRALGNDIEKGLEGIDWGGVASAVFEGMGAALGGLTAFIIGAIEKPWNDAVQWWHDTAYNDGEFTITGLLEGIWAKITGISAWIKEHIFDPFINGFKKAFGIASPSKVMAELGGFIIDGLLNGLLDAVSGIGAWIKEHVLDPILGVFDGAKAILEVGVQKAAEWVADAWEAAKMAGQTVKRVVQSALEKVGSWASDAWEATKMTASTIVKTVQSKLEAVGNWASDAWTAVKQGAKTVVNTVKAELKEAGNWTGEAWKAVKDGTEKIEKTVTVTLTKVWDTVKGWISKFTGGDTEQEVDLKKKSTWTTVSDWIKSKFMGDKTTKAEVDVTAHATKFEDKITGEKKVSGIVAAATSFLDTITGKKEVNGVTANAGSVTVANKDVSVNPNAQKITFGTKDYDVNAKANKITFGTTEYNVRANADKITMRDTEYSVKANAQKITFGTKDYDVNAKANKITFGTTEYNVRANATSVTIPERYKEISFTARISSFVGNIGNQLKSALGLAVGGIITSNGAVRSISQFASGGYIRRGYASWWNSVKKYASGTSKAHGSLFVAGEAGPEIVGHVNGRTEILNQSQLASAIYSAVLSAMATAFNNFASLVSQRMADCTNALISAVTLASNIEAPLPVTFPGSDVAVFSRIAALQTVPYQVPAYATGTVMPYEVVAEIRRQTGELKAAIHDEGEEIIQAIVSAISNHGLAMVDALQNSNQNAGQSLDLSGISRYVIDDINRQTVAGLKPLKS